MTSLPRLEATIVACRKCPRLIAHCRAIAQTKRRAYRDWNYWGKPVPGFGDPRARVLIVGLAPGAHGANRTGRMFTGDSSGATLFGALFRTGFASQPESAARDDGLVLTDLYVTASLRCAPPNNRPLPAEITRCRPYLVTELRRLTRVQVVVALGRLAHDALLGAARDAGLTIPAPKPKFAHAAEVVLVWGRRRIVLLDAYHPSQQNTQTGRLTPAMLDRVFSRAQTLVAPA